MLAAALALALLENGWELQAQPGVFHLRRATNEWNPFLAVHEMMAGKISSEAWANKCKELDVARLALTAGEQNGSAPLACKRRHCSTLKPAAADDPMGENWEAVRKLCAKPLEGRLEAGFDAQEDAVGVQVVTYCFEYFGSHSTFFLTKRRFGLSLLRG